MLSYYYLISEQPNSQNISIGVAAISEEKSMWIWKQIQLKSRWSDEHKKLLVNASGYLNQNRIKFSEGQTKEAEDKVFREVQKKKLLMEAEEFRSFKQAIREQTQKSILEYQGTKNSNSW